MKTFYFFLLTVLFVFSHCGFDADLVDINQFPSDYKVDYQGKMYSGYLTSTPGKKLHYVYFPSQRSESSDPLVLWLNGGPGCSSLAGLFNENGPFVFRDWSKDLYVNPYSWNQQANMLYIESPSGVGFSTGNSKNHNDSEVAYENVYALDSFFLKFPELLKNRFFISGESYAGIYIPTLAKSILDYNKRVIPTLQIKLEGLLIGNGVTHPDYDLTGAFIEFAYGHGLYNLDIKKEADLQCGPNPPYNLDNKGCQDVYVQIKETAGDINIYDIYRDCYPPDSVNLTEKEIQDNKRFALFTNPLYHSVKSENTFLNSFISQKLRDDPPCADVSGLTSLLNIPEFQDLLHVDRTEYSICNDTVNETYQWDPRFSFYLYPELLRNNLRILKYSGDTDAAVPFTGTRQWVKKLNLPLIKEYHAWFAYNSREIAGFVEKYDGLIFATVKGVGHMVPQWKRKESLYLFNQFLDGKDL